MALLWLSALFVLGIVLGGGIDSRLSAFACCVALLGAIVARHTRLGWPALLATALFLGFMRSPHPAGPPSSGELRFYNGKQVTVLGQISAEPDVRDSGAQYVVSAHSVTLPGRAAAPIAGRLELHTSTGQRLEYGDRVQLTGLMFTPRNSASLPYRDILHGKGIDSQMQFPRAVDLGPATSGLLGWIVPLRQFLERGINRSLPEPEAALLIAITLGAHSASLGSLGPALVSTGLIHLIAISGIKVAMVAGTVWALLAGLRRRLLSLTASLGVICLYVLLTGTTPSGVRSAIMWALVFIASYLGRGTVALVSLGFAAAMMAAFDPLLPWDIGFQLSVIGTVAIVAFSGYVLRLFRFLPSPFREAWGVTIAAQLGTIPIVAAGFHVLSPAGPVANAIVLPLVPLAIVLGFLLGVCSNVAYLAGPLSAMAFALTHAVIDVSRFLSGWSAAALAVPAPTPLVSAPYYAALGTLAWLVLRHVGWAPQGQWRSLAREASVALLLVASVITLSSVQGAAPTRLSFLGSGGSLVLQSDGRTAVIDGSSRPMDFLGALGEELGMRVRIIDLVVVTDPRSSNVAALVSLLDHYQVKAVLDVGAQYPSETYARWRATLRARHVPVYALRTGAIAHIGHVALRVLAPDAVCYAPPTCAGMFRLDTGHHSFLVATHADSVEQENIVFRRVPLRADTLFLGATDVPSTDFVHAVGAHTVWCAEPAPAPHSCARLPNGGPQHWPL